MSKKAPIYLVAQGRPEGIKTHPPYGILYVGQALRQAGYAVRLFHLHGDREGPVLEAIRETRPLFVGFSNFMSALLLHDLRLSEKVHALGVPVVWGGVYPTVCPELALASDCVDYIVQGEGESSAPLLAEALEHGASPQGIPGVGYKEKGELVLTPPPPPLENLDHFRPAWDLLDLESYAIPLPHAELRRFCFLVSRGCPFLAPSARAGTILNSPAGGFIRPITAGKNGAT